MKALAAFLPMLFLRRNITSCRLTLVLLLVLQQAVQVAFAALPQEDWAVTGETVVAKANHPQTHLPLSAEVFTEAMEEASEEGAADEENLTGSHFHGQEAYIPECQALSVLPEAIRLLGTDPAQRLHMPLFLWCRMLLI